ncbi:RluA family pseudouridine synthase [Rickettsia endosymbiont of Cantharis rufa]|uniref:RluA family pseudouridine synthase n=1 Tax=Rickettsia endosymbiont of Cantharis rufa TaxID=3066248 RepID=UPI00397E01F5
MIIDVNTPIPSRLDKYLKRLYPLLTQGIIEKALRQKQITVNSQKAEANLRVIDGDEIVINDKFNLPVKQPEKLVFTDAEIKLAKKITTNYLIYEDDNLIAINKPSGIATQGGSKINLSIDAALKYLNHVGADFIVNSVELGYKEQEAKPISNMRAMSDDVGKFKSIDYKLVHRLDKETSGLLLIAKNYLSSVKLHDAFKEKMVVKKYLAVTYGKPIKDIGEVRNNIGKSNGSTPKIIDIDNENGKLTITYYKLLKSLDNNLFLIEFTPVTGRMHQLRLHAKLLGCPILGDDKYGNKEIMPYSKYMFLHANSICLSEKVFGKEINLEAKLPFYFTKCLT